MSCHNSTTYTHRAINLDILGKTRVCKHNGVSFAILYHKILKTSDYSVYVSAEFTVIPYNPEHPNFFMDYILPCTTYRRSYNDGFLGGGIMAPNELVG
jgi:hypothetical protein